MRRPSESKRVFVYSYFFSAIQFVEWKASIEKLQKKLRKASKALHLHSPLVSAKLFYLAKSPSLSVRRPSQVLFSNLKKTRQVQPPPSTVRIRVAEFARIKVIMNSKATFLKLKLLLRMNMLHSHQLRQVSGLVPLVELHWNFMCLNFLLLSLYHDLLSKELMMFEQPEEVYYIY